MATVARLAFSEFAKFRGLFLQQRRQKTNEREDRGAETPAFPFHPLFSALLTRHCLTSRAAFYLKFHPGKEFFIFSVYVLRMSTAVSSGKFQTYQILLAFHKRKAQIWILLAICTYLGVRLDNQ